MRLSALKDLRQAVGRRVMANRAFSGIPMGTEGVVDEYYGSPETHEGVMVAWDLPSRPLPPGYKMYDGVPIVSSGILRDGFGREETHFLTLVD